MDTIGAFLDDCCVMSPTSECPATQLYLAFEQYARELGVRVPTRMEFGMELSRRGIGSRKSSTTIRTGVALRPASYGRGVAA
jgi:phage/plasmid-associated DNA primase